MIELAANLVVVVGVKERGESDEEGGYLQLVTRPEAKRVGSADGGRGVRPPSTPHGGAKTPPPILPSQTTTVSAPRLYPHSHAHGHPQPHISHRHSSPGQLPLSSDSPSFSTLRKNYESELLHKERERTMRILRARAGRLQRNDEYVSGLLQRRQLLRQRLNEKLSDLFQGLLSLDLWQSAETEKRRLAVRSALMDLAKREEDFVVIEPLLETFSTRNDPMAQHLRQTIKRFRNLLSLAEREADPTEAVEKALDDITLVEYQLVETLSKQFEDIAEPGLTLSVQVSLQQYLFSTSLGECLMSQLRRVCQEEDQRIRLLFLSISWEDLFARLRVRSKLQLPRDRSPDLFPISDLGPYQRPIEELRSLPSIPTPYGKIMALTRACNLLCHVYEEEGTEEALGSEDLLLLMAYVLVRAQIPDLASQLMFIARLVPEELVKGEPGYVLATVQTSLEYVLGQPE